MIWTWIRSVLYLLTNMGGDSIEMQGIYQERRSDDIPRMFLHSDMAISPKMLINTMGVICTIG